MLGIGLLILLDFIMDFEDLSDGDFDIINGMDWVEVGEWIGIFDFWMGEFIDF